MNEIFDWMVADPVSAISIGGAAAIALLVSIVFVRWASAAVGRRLRIGLRLAKKVEQESHWATRSDRASYNLRPGLRPWWAFWRRAC